MYVEKPIICFNDNGGMPEVVLDDVGSVVEGFDVAAMACTALSLLQDEQNRITVGQTGKNEF